MSLFSSLVKDSTAVVGSLDSLFKSSAGPVKKTAPIAAKVRAPNPEDLPEVHKKKEGKTPKPKVAHIRKHEPTKPQQAAGSDDDDDDDDVEEESTKSKNKKKVSVEDKYAAKAAVAKPKKESKKSRNAPQETKDLLKNQTTYDYGEQEEESKVEDLVHESLRGKNNNNNKRKSETEYSGPATSPPIVKRARKDPAEAVAAAAAAATATTKTVGTKKKSTATKTEGDSDDEDASPDTNKDGTKKSDSPERQARTAFVGNLAVAAMTQAEFRKLKTTFGKYGDVESIRFRSIAFSELLPRKVAFITGKLHPERDVLNAYVVYKNKDSVAKAVAGLNGQLFLNKHLRVDTVAGEKNHQPKKSVFVGNVAFDAQEEDLWNFFKDSGDIENVRIIRDRRTNLGKGFAYVTFQDRASVDVALRLHETKMGTRKMRVVRCKRLEEDVPQTNGFPSSSKRSTKTPAQIAGGAKAAKAAAALGIRPQHAPITKQDGAAKRLAFKDRKTKEKHILMKKKAGGIVEGERSQKGTKIDLGIKKGKSKVKANVPKKKVVKK